MSDKVKNYIKELFVELNEEVTDIVKNSCSVTMATQNIMECVSSRIAASSQGYMVDLYGILSRKTLNEDIFHDPANANKFYELNMRQKISDVYQFEVQDLKTYNAGINFEEINRVYTSASVTVGSAAVGGILLGVLSGMVKIPMAVIIAGAVLSGIGGGAVTYLKIVPEKNRDNFLNAVKMFMVDLEKELLNWVDEVVKFYNQKVDELKATL